MTIDNLMEKQEMEIVESILRQFSVALKSLRFYPPNHSIPCAAVDKLHQLLADFLQARKTLTVGISKNGITYNSENLGNDGQKFSRLAYLLYGYKLRQLGFLPGITQTELVDFLSILCMDVEDVLKSGGINELLDQKTVYHIVIKELALKIIDFESTPVRRSDIKITPDKIEDLQRLLEPGFSLTDDEERRVLIRFKLDPANVADFLLQLAKKRSHDKDGDSEINYLADVLIKVNEMIGKEPLDEQIFLARNLAESLMLLPEDIRRKLLNRLFEYAPMFNLTERLLEQLAPDELSHLISQATSSEQLTLYELESFIKKLPIRQKNMHAIISKLIEKLSPNEQIRTDLSFLLKTQEAVDSAENEFMTGDDILAVLDIRSDDIHSIAGETAELEGEKTTQTAVAVLSESLATSSDATRCRQIADSLTSLLSESLKKKHLHGAISALTELQEAAQSDLSRRALIKEALKSFPSKGVLADLIMFIRQDTDKNRVKAALEFLHRLGKPAINILLDLLAVEEKAATRKIICNIIAKLSKDEIANLGLKISDHRWYLVRNVVHILGTLKNPQAVDPLRRTASHTDSRVRQETALSLTAIGGRDAAKILIDLLSDGDPLIRKTAVNGLGLIGGDSDDEILIDLLKKRDIFYRNWDFHIEIIKALGRLSSQRAIPILKDISGRRSWFFRTKNKLLQSAAMESLAQIKTERRALDE